MKLLLPIWTAGSAWDSLPRRALLCHLRVLGLLFADMNDLILHATKGLT